MEVIGNLFVCTTVIILDWKQLLCDYNNLSNLINMLCIDDCSGGAVQILARITGFFFNGFQI